MNGLTFDEVASLGCADCGGDIDGEGRCIDCGAWLEGLAPPTPCQACKETA